MTPYDTYNIRILFPKYLAVTNNNSNLASVTRNQLKVIVMEKLKFNFNLKCAKSTSTLVLIVIRWGDNMVRVSSKVNVDTKMWNKDIQRCITSKELFTDRENRAATKANKALNKIQEEVTEYLKACPSEHRVYKYSQEMKAAVTYCVDKVINGTQEEENKQKQSATEWMMKYIDSDRIDSHTGRYVAERTKIHQRTVVHRLQSFLSECGLSDSFTTFTSKDFESKYTNWCYKVRNYKQNTVIATFGVLKPLLNAAKKDGIEIDDTNYKNLQGKGKDVDNIYLTEDEIKALYMLDIPKLKAEGLIDSKSTCEATRDLFIIACWTGLRRSDINKLNDGVWSVKDGEELLYITAEKTKRQVVIPLHPYVKAIYKKYNGVLPKLIDKGRCVEHLKMLGMLAGIDEITPIVENRGGVVKTLQYKKYQLIGFHTARRSFATNMYLRQFPTISIMQLTGHTTESNFLKYIKVTPEQNALMVAEMWKKTMKPF